jgi:hypothetical protein
MTEEKAEKVANILIGVAAVGAVCYVLKDRARRRALGRVALRAAAASGPWLIGAARQAWAESAMPAGSSPDPDARAPAI